MDLPAEVVLTFTLKPGAVYLFKHDLFPDNHHFFVILNKSVGPGDTLFLACATSQVQKKINWVTQRNISMDTLVIVGHTECDFLTKQTAFDCNTVNEISYEVLREKLDRHEVPSVMTISDAILTRLRDAVHISPMISRKIKILV